MIESKNIKAFLTRNWLLICLTMSVVILFAIIPIALPRSDANWPPSLGDFGDYIGGAVAMIVFMWLVAGHFENQKHIANTNRDIEIQLDLTREVVGALATIAAGNKVQASEVRAGASPLFVHIGSTGQQSGRHMVAVHPTSGHFSFRNEGSHVRLVSVRLNSNDLNCKIEGNQMCGTGSTFRLFVASAKPLQNAWPMELTVLFENKIKISGWAKIRVKSFEDTPDIAYGVGIPEAN